MPFCAYFFAVYITFDSLKHIQLVESYTITFFLLWLVFFIVVSPIILEKCNFRNVYGLDDKSIVISSISSVVGFAFPLFYDGYYPFNEYIIDDPTLITYVVIYMVHATTWAIASMSAFSILSSK
ncbi:hypothetical protein PsAD5_02350 [Pseudovibrio sp. Ad5]|nr:hypothetical protein PsAD5_02350 [Pseudovibrio sp. Ad5]